MGLCEELQLGEVLFLLKVNIMWHETTKSQRNAIAETFS